MTAAVPIPVQTAALFNGPIAIPAADQVAPRKHPIANPLSGTRTSREEVLSMNSLEKTKLKQSSLKRTRGCADPCS